MHLRDKRLQLLGAARKRLLREKQRRTDRDAAKPARKGANQMADAARMGSVPGVLLHIILRGLNRTRN
jgi:hypothetical protein